MTLHDGEMQVLSNDVDGRTTLVCIGMSGSGKSRFIGRFAEAMQRLHPKAEIFVLSRCRDDEAFDKLKSVKYVELDDTFADDAITADDFPEGSILIFDDTHTIRNKDTIDAVMKLQRDVLEVGRKRKLHVLSSVHYTDGKKTSHLWNVSQSIVIYPHGSSAHAIRYILERHCGLAKQDVSKILKLNSRWVCIKRSYPLAVIFEHGVYLPTVNRE